MKKLFAVLSLAAVMLCFASCSEGGNIEDSSSGGGLVSDVESVVSSVVSDVKSNAGMGSDADSGGMLNSATSDMSSSK